MNVFRDNVRNAETSTEHRVCREGASAEDRAWGCGVARDICFNNKPNGIPTAAVFYTARGSLILTQLMQLE